MKMFLVILTLVLYGFCAADSDPAVVLSQFTAMIQPDSGDAEIKVAEFKLRMEYKGYGLYSPQDYPTTTAIPLVNGILFKFENIKSITLHGERVFWKRFVQPEERANYVDVKEDGYREYSDVEVMLTITDWSGKETTAMLKRPENSDVFFEGITENGAYRLQIDLENKKTVAVTFLSSFIMRCTGDPTHVFENAEYKFCPLCGKPMQREVSVQTETKP